MISKLSALLLGCVLAFSLAVCGQTEKAGAYEAFTAADPFQIPCATNYKRIQPHFCRFNGAAIDFQTLTIDGTCRATAFTSLPAGATAYNTVSNKTFLGLLYSDNTCTNGFTQAAQTIREAVATVANTQLGTLTVDYPSVPLIAGQVQYQINPSSQGASANLSLSVLGYYD